MAAAFRQSTERWGLGTAACDRCCRYHVIRMMEKLLCAESNTYSIVEYGSHLSWIRFQLETPFPLPRSPRSSRPCLFERRPISFVKLGPSAIFSFDRGPPAPVPCASTERVGRSLPPGRRRRGTGRTGGMDKPARPLNRERCKTMMGRSRDS